MTGARYAIVHEQEEATLAEVLDRLAPADLVLVEGFKRDSHPKIEVRGADSEPMVAQEHNIVAVAADVEPANRTLPWFRRDDIAGIANFIAGRRR